MKRLTLFLALIILNGECSSEDNVINVDGSLDVGQKLERKVDIKFLS